jgi:urease accessory protein
MNLALIRLLHLASPTLPVGAYTYSQGLEWAVESGAIRNEASAGQWFGDCLSFSLASFEAVYLAHMLSAWRDSDTAQLEELNAEFIASRETAELRAETLQMGHSLVKLLQGLPDFADVHFPLPNPSPACGGWANTSVSFPLAWSCAAARWRIETEDAIAGYLWAWLENQVMAALKAVPLGQTAGQRLLLSLGERLPALAKQAAVTPLDQARNFLPAFAIASSLHETQYTRIFRS